LPYHTHSVVVLFFPRLRKEEEKRRKYEWEIEIGEKQDRQWVEKRHGREVRTGKVVGRDKKNRGRNSLMFL
jgi:RNA-splicing ligase RtcB